MIDLLTKTSREVFELDFGIPTISKSIMSWRLMSTNIEELRPLVVAHIDTCNVFEPDQKAIRESRGIISLKKRKHQCLGGDDRCGVWILRQLAQACPDKFHFMLFDLEESGAIGSTNFAQCELPYHNSFTCYIGLDRRGGRDMVNYDYGNFELEDAFGEYGYKLKRGSISDVLILAENSDKACINLSVGYYNEHTSNEYIVIKEMERTLETMIDIDLDGVFYSDIGFYYEDDEDDWQSYNNINDYEGSFDEYPQAINQ